MKLHLTSLTKQLFITPLFIFAWYATIFFLTCQTLSQINSNITISGFWTLLPLALYCIAFYWIQRYAVIFYVTMFIIFAGIPLGNFIFLVISCYAGMTFRSFIICSSIALISYLFTFIHFQRKIDWTYIKRQIRLGHRELANGYFQLKDVQSGKYSLNHIYISSSTAVKPWRKLINIILVDLIIIAQPIAGFIGVLVNRYSPAYATYIILSFLACISSLLLISTTQIFYINAKIIYIAQKNLGRPILINDRETS